MLCVPILFGLLRRRLLVLRAIAAGGESFPMGIYINADEVVSSGHTEVKYDPEMLEYVTGGDW